MNHALWAERWKARQIGFHEGAPNALLVAHASRLEGCTRVYVPLCGKALDLPFLQSRGHDVVGTEIVRTAIDELFGALEVPPEVSSVPPFVRHAAKGLTVLEGDAFALEPGHLGGLVDAVYDRAALVAVDPSTREAYVASLARVLRPGGRLLLIGFEYPQALIGGPPWSVSTADVEALFGATFTVELLEERAGNVNPRLRSAGVTEVWERAYLLVKRS